MIKVKNEMKMTLLTDGVVSVDTDAFSEEVHMEAEQLANEIFDELGGEHQIVQHKPHKQPHAHTHVHQTIKA